MDQDGIVLGLVHIQHRRQLLVFHLDQAHGVIHLGFGLSRNDGHRVAHKAQVAVQDQAVVGAGLRKCLPCQGETLLGHVLVGQNALDSRQLLGHGAVDLRDHGVGVGASEHLHHQAVPGSNVRGVNRLAGHQGHGVLLDDGSAHHAV